MKRLMAVVATAILVMGGGGVAEAEEQRYRQQWFDCFIDGIHYGAIVDEIVTETNYRVTSVWWNTNPRTKAHRVEWRAQVENNVEFAMGWTVKTKNDVVKTRFWHPNSQYVNQELKMKVWDRGDGKYCTDSYPVIKWSNPPE